MTDLTTPLLAQDDEQHVDSIHQASNGPFIEEIAAPTTPSPSPPPPSPPPSSPSWWQKSLFKLTYLWDELLDLIYWHLWTPLYRLIFFKNYTTTPAQEGEQLHRESLLQSRRLEQIQQRASTPYDPKILEHQQHLQRLWQASFPGITFPASINSPRWKEMGWQGENPQSDFRGCGFLSLYLLTYFAEERPEEFVALMKKTRGNRSQWEYPFAAAGVNITFMLMEILELKNIKINENNTGQALPREVQGFLKLLGNDEYALESLFIESFILLDKVWLEQEASYMEFSQVLVQVKHRVRKVLARRWLREIDDLRSIHY